MIGSEKRGMAMISINAHVSMSHWGEQKEFLEDKRAFKGTHVHSLVLDARHLSGSAFSNSHQSVGSA